MSKRYSVLIVDDDKFLLEMYRKKFEQDGATVELATSSEEALSRLRTGSEPDVLLLDIIMPGMDGLELLENIRKENLAPNSSVIFLTNESQPEKIALASSLGARGYIVKATSIPTEVVEETKKIAGLNS